MAIDILVIPQRKTPLSIGELIVIGKAAAASVGQSPEVTIFDLATHHVQAEESPVLHGYILEFPFQSGLIAWTGDTSGDNTLLFEEWDSDRRVTTAEERRRVSDLWETAGFYIGITSQCTFRGEFDPKMITELAIRTAEILMGFVIVEESYYSLPKGIYRPNECRECGLKYVPWDAASERA